MPKELRSGADARDPVLSGAKKAAEQVVATMGPKGRNILIERPGRSPFATKDGVSVLNEISLPDPFENMGVDILKQAARKTNDAAGDGTTTATLLAVSFMEQGIKVVDSGKNVISVKAGMDFAVNKIVDYLDSMKKPIENRDDYKAIATISSQDSEVGDMISRVLEKVGPNGVVTVEAGSGFGLEEQYVEGMEFDNGYTSPYFVTDPSRMQCILDSVKILLTDERIVSIQQILPLLDALGKSGEKKLVIIAEDVEGDAEATLIVNKLKNNFLGVPVKAPGFGARRTSMLHDLAAITGATVISRETGTMLDKATPDMLGFARRVVIGKHQTTIVEGGGAEKDIETRIGEIKKELELADKPREVEVLQDRLARLSGGIGIIKVGAATEFEQKELQHRVEDALSATKAAVEEGIVPGGGIAYVRAVQALEKDVLAELKNDDEKLGAQIIFDALPSCLLSICDNAGHNGDEVLANVQEKKGSYGFNAATGEYGDMVKMQIINPKKVERCALQNASSVAGMFLTLEGAMADIRVPEDQK